MPVFSVFSSGAVAGFRLGFMLALGLLFVGAPLGTAVWAQKGVGGDLTITGAEGFEGKLVYTFDYDKRLGEELQYANAVDRMALILKAPDYVVHLFGSQYRSEHEDPYALPLADRTFPITRLYIADSNKMYVLDNPNERVFAGEKFFPEDSLPPVAHPTGRNDTILGFLCAEYHVEKADEDIWYWVSNKVWVNTDLFEGKEATARANFLTKGLQGRIPLRIVRKSKEHPVVQRVEVEQIEPMELHRMEFRFPSHYEIRGYDWRR